MKQKYGRRTDLSPMKLGPHLVTFEQNRYSTLAIIKNTFGETIGMGKHKSGALADLKRKMNMR